MRHQRQHTEAASKGSPRFKGTCGVAERCEILVDGEQGLVHLRPDESVSSAFKDKIAMEAKAQQRYSAIRHLPAKTLDKSRDSISSFAPTITTLQVKKDKIKLDPKGDQNFLTYTGKEVGDSW